MSRKIITRAEAIALGLDEYFTGEPCARGGVAERSVKGWKCKCDKCMESARARRAKWGLSNPDYNKDYYKAGAQKQRERCAKYRKENPQAAAQSKRNWYAKNIDKSKAAHRNWRDKNKDKIAVRMRAWRQANKILALKYRHKRRAQILRAIPIWFGELDEFILQEAADLAVMRERATGIPWHVDHMVPLQAREAYGLHVGKNLQVIPAALNLQKKNKMQFTSPGEWVMAL